ncbi:hypothetical protein JHJ32_17605 [Parapedobacter sp. ISTM3]|nr:hypothetical protein [Parapedobacter sp. ISTM3]MBK1441820.1 hypothetical protein [Parapedobacter sp. ISTM3]
MERLVCLIRRFSMFVMPLLILTSVGPSRTLGLFPTDRSSTVKNFQQDWKQEVKAMKAPELKTYLSPETVDSVINTLPKESESIKFFILDPSGIGKATSTPVEDYQQLKMSGKQMTLTKYRNHGSSRAYKYL